jgi:hypothetical protein
VGSTLKVRPPEAKTLIDKIKAEIKKRAELKAQRMLLKEPKGSRSASRSTEVELAARFMRFNDLHDGLTLRTLVRLKVKKIVGGLDVYIY